MTRHRRSSLAHRAYAALLRLLVPRWLRVRAGDEMLATFAARLDAAATPRERARELARELGGLCRVAVLARGPAAPAATSTVHPRPQRRPPMLDVIRQDLGFALRAMRRSRGVTVLAVLTLALGIGTSTAMFSVLDAVLLRPLPFEEPERIVLVYPTIEEWRDNPSLHELWQQGRFSPPELRSWLERQRSFEAAGGYTSSTARVSSGAGSERIAVGQATAGFWAALRVTPQLGRLPAPDEREPVVLLTHELWTSRYGGDSALVGRDIRLNDRSVRVIGVLPASFELVGVSADAWRPYVLPTGDEQLGNHMIIAVGRLRDGVPLARAGEELAAILGGVDAADPQHLTHRGHLVSPVQQATADVRLPLLILASASLLLLLAACANVALLLLGAGADRVRELAVRQALGARKRRIALQLLVESVALGVAGAAAGVLVALATVRVLVAIIPAGVPRIGDVSVDVRTFGVAALLAVATGVISGCVPALSLSRVDAAESLRAGATTPGRGRLQHVIVAAELALATVLLVGAGLLTRTLAELQRVRPGFEADGLFTAQLVLPWDHFYRPGGDEAAARAALGTYVRELTEGVRTIPGVSDVALSSDMPYSGDRGTNPVEPEGYQPAPGEVVDAARRFVTGNYFDVMRIRPVQGRLLTAADARPDAERVMVVTDAFARHFWPDGRWLDRQVGFWGDTYRVVGVIADTREHDLRGDDDRYKFYVPALDPATAADNLLIRTRLSAAQLVPALRERVWRIDRSIVVEDALPMPERIARSLADDRYRMRLMTAFSLAAALFSLLGIYGVTSRAVVRRRRELGLRVALGAPRGRILGLVLGEAARVGTVGVLLGVALALVATRVLAGLVWGVPRLDPLTYGAAALLLLALTLAAALGPARRAAGVEPMRVIRN
ncbi:MAG TPA: ADOP family duplicated permease [Gemmatimonadaceae bacterium]|nr:ADOP family duplicated permease [Gemmatimonadaceae bacterium]